MNVKHVGVKVVLSLHRRSAPPLPLTPTCFTFIVSLPHTHVIATGARSGPARFQRTAARAPAIAASPARRGRRHLLLRALFFGEVATSTARCVCPRTPLALSRAPHPPHPPPTLL